MKKIWLIPLFLLVLFTARTAEGGILSTITNFLTSSIGRASALTKQEEIIKTETNSQNLDLPEPDINIATSSPKSEIDQAIVDDSAIMPEAGPLGTAADLKDNQAPADLISVYTVHSGDTVDTVAKMFGVSSNTVRWANDLKKGTPLHVGDNLVILPITGVQHVVKKGDTIKSLAKKYGGDVEEIITYNDLDPTKSLTVGETVIVPNGEESTIVTGSKTGQKVPTKYKGPSYAGYFMRPISGGVRTQGIHGHNAIDLAAPIGTPLYAAASGRIIIAKTGGWNGGYGNYVVIAHPNGTQTLYGHMNRVMVSVGQKVDKGDQIGQLGSTGHSTGPHVHFEIRGASNPF